MLLCMRENDIVRSCKR